MAAALDQAREQGPRWTTATGRNRSGRVFRTQTWCSTKSVKMTDSGFLTGPECSPEAQDLFDEGISDQVAAAVTLGRGHAASPSNTPKAR